MATASVEPLSSTPLAAAACSASCFEAVLAGASSSTSSPPSPTGTTGSSTEETPVRSPDVSKSASIAARIVGVLYLEQGAALHHLHLYQQQSFVPA